MRTPTLGVLHAASEGMKDAVADDASLYLIDPPGPWSPAEEWHEFIAELEGMEQTPQVVEELRQARAHLNGIDAQDG